MSDNGGRWIKRAVDEHRCPKPYLLSTAPDAEVGDIWQCACGVKWKVLGFDSGMQHDPYPTVITWGMFSEHGIYASGTK